MAEEGGKGIMSDGDAIGYLTGILVFLVIVAVLLDQLLAVLGGGLSLLDRFLLWLEPYLVFLFTVAFFVSAFLVAVIVYLNREIGRVLAEMRAEKYPDGNQVVSVFGDEDSDENPKWKRVLEHIESDNQADWRLAIIEADIMLGELLDAQGYTGETIGDKLKKIEISDFQTLNEAWEAHKVRNQIAHEGSDFLISEREARRIINLFRQVFEEFRYI